jgi:DNA-binding beta-propeller fold protein YncE
VLGIRFNPNNQAFLWVLDGGDCFAPPPCTPPQILEVNPATGNSTRLAITFQNDARLNGITFDGAGNAYVSDSNLGRIYQIPVGNPGGTNIWSSGSFMGDPLLRPAMPPGGITPTFGANGIEFMPLGCTPGVTPGCVLLVANTANRTILQMTCCDMNNRANPATVLLNAVNGPDGIAIDPATGFIWVAANQSDEIVAIQPSTGPNALPRVIAKLGDFNGIAATQDGGWRVRGLLFPSSLAFSNLNPPPMFPPPAQRTLYVANTAFTGINGIDTEWANLITRFTVAIIPVPTITGCPANPIPLPPPCGLFRP